MTTPNNRAAARTLAASLQRHIRTKLMIAIPLLLTVLVFGACFFFYYVIKAHFAGLADDADVYLFLRVMKILERQIVVWSAAAAVMGVALAYAITLPLRQLTESARGVASGDWSRSVRINSEAELVALGKSFNGMLCSLNEQISESMQGGLITVNQQGMIATFNRLAEVILGWSAADVVDKPASVLGPALGAVVAETMRRQQQLSALTMAVNTKHGAAIQVSVSSSLLRDTHNAVIGAVIAVKDAARMRDIEAHIRRADRLAAVGSLAAGIAHEIRNPLGSIKGMAQLMQQTRAADKVVEYGQVITREVDRLNGVVQELLNFAQPETESVAAPAPPVDVRLVIERIIQLIAHDAAEAGIRIERDFSAEPAMVLAAEKKIQQALLNIVLNALAAMKPSGHGVLRLRAQPAAAAAEVAIAVSDSGGGIPAEALPRIFDPFYSTRSNGTGLGLTITHHIVAEYGGRIDVKSPAAQGTTFTVYLPAYQPESGA